MYIINSSNSFHDTGLFLHPLKSQSLFFNKIAGPYQQLYLKKGCDTSVFLWILQNF